MGKEGITSGIMTALLTGRQLHEANEGLDIIDKGIDERGEARKFSKAIKGENLF